MITTEEQLLFLNDTNVFLMYEYKFDSKPYESTHESLSINVNNGIIVSIASYVPYLLFLDLLKELLLRADVHWHGNSSKRDNVH